MKVEFIRSPQPPQIWITNTATTNTAWVNDDLIGTDTLTGRLMLGAYNSCWITFWMKAITADSVATFEMAAFPLSGTPQASDVYSGARTASKPQGVRIGDISLAATWGTAGANKVPNHPVTGAVEEWWPCNSATLTSPPGGEFLNIVSTNAAPASGYAQPAIVSVADLMFFDSLKAQFTTMTASATIIAIAHLA